MNLKPSQQIRIPIFIVPMLIIVLLSVPVRGQDPDAIVERYRTQLEKITNDEQAKVFFTTHLGEAFGLTKDIMGFIDKLHVGEYAAQIEYIMSVPEQRWNMAGWGFYERVDVVRTVNKNISQTTALNRVTNNMSKIGKGLKVFGLAKDIYQGIAGDDQAKLKAISTTWELVRDYWLSDWSGLSIAMMGVSVIDYALTQFINTAKREYEEYWWNAYSNYYGKVYPSFVNDWASLSEREGFAGIERRLHEFWTNPEDYAIRYYGQAQWQMPPALAESTLKESFAARYYRDYIHQSLKTWYMRKALTEEYQAERALLHEFGDVKQLVEEMRMLMHLIRLAEEEMRKADDMPVSITVGPTGRRLAVGETGVFEAIAVFGDNAVETITLHAETQWSGGSNTFTAVVPGPHEITATYRGVSGSATIEVVCPDGTDWIGTLNKCGNIDEAIEDIVGEEEDESDMCDEVLIRGFWEMILQSVAEANGIYNSFNGKYQWFYKTVHDQNSNVCSNSMLASAFAGARRDVHQYEMLIELVQQLSTALIISVGICPDLEFQLDARQLITEIGRLGGPYGDMNQGIASMQSMLQSFGCDEQEFTELGDQFAENTVDPDVMQAGGHGGREICGDGIDNNGNGLIDEGCEAFGNFNVTAHLYDSGSLPDDAFALSISGQGNVGVTPVGGARVYPLNLAPGTYTATVTVILAPDNVGTFTLTIYQGERIILGPISGGPPEGTSVSYEFIVSSDAPAATAGFVLPLFDEHIVFFDEGFTGTRTGNPEFEMQEIIGRSNTPKHFEEREGVRRNAGFPELPRKDIRENPEKR